MRRAYQLTAFALRSLAGAIPAAAGLLIGAGAGYLLWPRPLPEASALVVLPFAMFGAVAGWLAFRIPLPKPVTHGSAWFRSRGELDAFRGPDGLIAGRAAQPDHGIWAVRFTVPAVADPQDRFLSSGLRVAPFQDPWCQCLLDVAGLAHDVRQETPPPRNVRMLLAFAKRTQQFQMAHRIQENERRRL